MRCPRVQSERFGGHWQGLRNPHFFRFDSGGSLPQLRPDWINIQRDTHGYHLDCGDNPDFVALFCADQAIHKFIQESVAKCELTMALQTSDGMHLAFAGMKSVCARFVKVLKLQPVFEKILNLKKDGNDPVTMISQRHLELTFQSHLMVVYGV